MFFVTVEPVTMSGLPLNLNLVFVAARVWNTSPVGSFRMVDRGSTGTLSRTLLPQSYAPPLLSIYSPEADESHSQELRSRSLRRFSANHAEGDWVVDSQSHSSWIFWEGALVLVGCRE